MPTRRSVLAGTAALPFASLLPAGAAWADTPKGIVVMAKQIDDVVSFDPAESYEFTDNEVDGNCYRKLVAPDPTDSNKVVGDLAGKYEISDDGLTFTFHLIDTSKFEGGRVLDAHDAEFSLQRVVVLNKTPGFILTQFGYTKDNVADLVRATDARTLVMKLPKPIAPSFVLFCLTANVACIVDKETVTKNAQGDDMGNGWLKTHTAGSGAYKLTSWTASDHVICDANPDSGIPVGVKRVVLRHVADAPTQLLLLQKGDVDIARNLGADQLKSIKGNAAFHQSSAAQASSMYIAMNQTDADLAKPQVIEAIKWAIDYDAIASNITPGTWEVQQNFLPKGLPGALDSQPYKHDPAKAKQLLAAAGLPDGFSVTMDYISATPSSDIAQAIQANLAAVGIKVQLLPGEQKQVITKTRARTHQLAMLVWGSDYFDPNSNAQAFCANPNDGPDSKLKILAWRSHFVNKTLTDEVEEAVQEKDSAKRIALYEEMQRQFRATAPFAMLLQQVAVAVMKKDVTGFALGPMPDYSKYSGIKKS